MDEKQKRDSRRGVKLRRYTAEERAAVLADVPRLGCSGAGKKHGVPEASAFRWAKAAGITKSSHDDEAARVTALPPPSAPTTAAAKNPSPLPKAVASAKAISAARTANTSPGVTDKPTERPTVTPAAKTKTVARSYTPSSRAEILEYASARGATAAATRYQVSRFSIYDWQRKVAAAAKGEGPSPTSGPGVTEIEARRDKEILDEWSRHPGLGPSQIRNQLRRKGVKVSVHTARRVMEESGYRPPKVARHPHDQRFESVRPNHLWHLDFVHRNIHRANTFTLILLDDHSRFVVGEGVDDAERADLVIGTFERAVARYGRPEMVMHDRGAAFWAWNGISRFTALLTEMGIDQV